MRFSRARVRRPQHTGPRRRLGDGHRLAAAAPASQEAGPRREIEGSRPAVQSERRAEDKAAPWGSDHPNGPRVFPVRMDAARLLWPIRRGLPWPTFPLLRSRGYRRDGGSCRGSAGVAGPPCDPAERRTPAGPNSAAVYITGACRISWPPLPCVRLGLLFSRYARVNGGRRGYGGSARGGWPVSLRKMRPKWAMSLRPTVRQTSVTERF